MPPPTSASGATVAAVSVTTTRLLITYHPHDLPPGGDPLVVSSPAPLYKYSRYEPAGLSFHEAAKRLAGFHAAGEEDAEEVDEGKGEKVKDSVDSSADAALRFHPDPDKQAAMLLEEQRGETRAAMKGEIETKLKAIQLAARDAALRFHPDKQAAMLLEEQTDEARAAKKEEIETKFKAIQLAYETLSDPAKRRVKQRKQQQQQQERKGEEWETPVTEEELESLGQALELEKLRALCDKLESLSASAGSDAAAGTAAVKRQTLRLFSTALKVNRWDGHSPDFEYQQIPVVLSESAAAAAAAAAAEREAEAEKEREARRAAGGSGKPWTREEIELLRKAVGKFPKGTGQRWEVIGEYLGTGRSAEEVVRATKTVLLQKPDDTKAFDSFLQRRKNPKDIASPLSTREEVDAAAAAPAAAAAAAAAAPAGAQEGESAGAANGVAAEAGAAGAGAAGAGASAGAEGAVDVWGEAQEVALVKALKAFPKDTDKRWDRIAAAVPGKSKAQCFKKFSELRQSFRTKKSGAAE
ncbi:unnamed protein product [Closterium sp. Naga37s-1]|nr:unnamed protein product [Closterium sp. Naga37s-1]